MRALIFAVCVLTLTGCVELTDDEFPYGPEEGAAGAGGAGGGAPGSYEAVQARFNQSCVSGCHGGTTPFAALSLEPEVSYDQLVGPGFTQIPSTSLSCDGLPRVVPGDPDASGIWFRMTQRDNGDQMPPIASEFVDDAGVALIDDWITQL